MGVKNLVMIETISSAKLATAVNKGAVKHGRETPIDVLVQVSFHLNPSACLIVLQSLTLLLTSSLPHPIIFVRACYVQMIYIYY